MKPSNKNPEFIQFFLKNSCKSCETESSDKSEESGSVNSFLSWSFCSDFLEGIVSRLIVFEVWEKFLKRSRVSGSAGGGGRAAEEQEVVSWESSSSTENKQNTK